MLVIKNGKDSQTLTFGYSCLKALGQKWNLEGISSVVNHILKTLGIFFDENGNPLSIEDIQFEVIDILAEILEAASGQQDFNGSSYGDFIFANFDQVGKVFDAFIQSLPQEKKQLAPKKK
jgi:galactokinase/mevalonate kinase-like predicted kinase